MSDTPIEALRETSRWRARDVTYWAGKWSQLSTIIPEFKIEDFKADGDAPANPYLKTVVRLPRTPFEQLIPVGTVSNTYPLAQHKEVAEKCFEGIQSAGIPTSDLRCEVGLSALGEWMNLRIYFPEQFNYKPRDGKELGLRVECFNSVDGSSRLVILLGWIRFICSNGMVIGETKAELRATHDQHLNLKSIVETVSDGLEKVKADQVRLRRWEQRKIDRDKLKGWVNKKVTDAWGKKAACRVFHICEFGHDVEFADPFARGEAKEKPVIKKQKVPGAPDKAETLYDVSQARSWLATDRNNAEERMEWQSNIPTLVESLAQFAQVR